MTSEEKKNQNTVPPAAYYDKPTPNVRTAVSAWKRDTIITFLKIQPGPLV